MENKFIFSLFLAMICFFTSSNGCDVRDICIATRQDINDQFPGIQFQRRPSCECNVDARSICDVLQRQGPYSPKNLCELTMSSVFKNVTLDPRLSKIQCDNCTMMHNLCNHVNNKCNAKTYSISFSYIVTKTTATPSLTPQSVSPSFSYQISMTINNTLNGTITPSTSHATSSLPTSSINNGSAKNGKVKRALLYFAVVITIALIVA
eukprot:TCONS_00072004-protein